ncbi:MAG: HEAT repeat domain-containing protein [Planctomycetes bacterium]|nr:HEAT repeat domain-containing protein [Planctomycetota bacterium]MBI3846472.1 HEAT repeat domain-containing protein [Planctomycetota bacterium]
MDSHTRRWLGVVVVLGVAGVAIVVYALLRPASAASPKLKTAAETVTFGSGAGSNARTRQGKSGSTAEEEPSDEIKAWLAKLEAAIRENDRHQVEVLVYEGRDSLGYALPLIEKLLGECETPQRLLCVLVLSRMKDADSLDVLRSLLVPKEDPAIKVAVIEALVERHDVEWGAKVLDFYLDPNEAKAVRLAAIQAMRTLGRPEFAKAILKMFIADTDQELKVAALLALGALKNQEVVQGLLDADKTENFKRGIRKQLIMVLGQLGSDEALAFLNEIASRGDVLDLRREAIIALRMIGSEKAQDALADLALNTEEKEIRFDAIHNLACLPGDKAKEVLDMAVERHWDEKDIRELCAQGLLAQPSPDCAKKAIDVMKRDPDMNPEFFKVMNKRSNVSPEFVRALAGGARDIASNQRLGLVDAFGDVKGDGEAAASEALRGILDSEENLEIQQKAMWGLAKHKDATSLPLLQRYYRTSTDADVRDAAIGAAQYLDGPEVEAFLQDVVEHETNYGLKMAAQGALNEVLKRKH